MLLFSDVNNKSVYRANEHKSIYIYIYIYINKSFIIPTIYILEMKEKKDVITII